MNANRILRDVGLTTNVTIVRKSLVAGITVAGLNHVFYQNVRKYIGIM